MITISLNKVDAQQAVFGDSYKSEPEDQFKARLDSLEGQVHWLAQIKIGEKSAILVTPPHNLENRSEHLKKLFSLMQNAVETELKKLGQ